MSLSAFSFTPLTPPVRKFLKAPSLSFCLMTLHPSHSAHQTVVKGKETHTCRHNRVTELLLTVLSTVEGLASLTLLHRPPDSLSSQGEALCACVCVCGPVCVYMLLLNPFQPRLKAFNFNALIKCI